jgi:Domain of unknown function (DUF397)
MESTNLDSPWRKATYSGTSGNGCVEVATAGEVLVRDTTNRDGGTLTLTADGWRAFTDGLKTALADTTERPVGTSKFGRGAFFMGPSNPALVSGSRRGRCSASTGISNHPAIAPKQAELIARIISPRYSLVT